MKSVKKKNDYLSKQASKELRNDRDFVMTSVKQNGYTLKYASKKLKNDRDIVMACQALKVIANSGQIVNLVYEKSMKRIMAVYESEDLHMKFR